MRAEASVVRTLVKNGTTPEDESVRVVKPRAKAPGISKPSYASRIAGSTSSAHGRVPKRVHASHRPAIVPGVTTDL